MGRPVKDNKTGEIKVNNFGTKMKIIKYNNYNDIIVEFENGYKTKSSYKEFKNCSIKSPYCKSIYEVAFIGEGEHKVSIDGKNTTIYQYWISMIRRCYSETALIKNPNYRNCSVSDLWLNYQNFGEWYNSNFYTVDSEIMCLDKDILYKRNHVYSPETCIFVPEKINKLFIKTYNYKEKRGLHPIGVRQNKHNNLYSAQCSVKINNKNILKYLGQYNTPEEAFYLGYKPFKENYIKEVADEYKTRIPKKLYDTMYNWKIEITD